MKENYGRACPVLRVPRTACAQGCACALPVLPFSCVARCNAKRRSCGPPIVSGSALYWHRSYRICIFASSSSQSCNFSSSPGALRQRFPMTMVFATRRISGVNSVFQPYSFEIGINLSYTPCASFVGKSHCRSRPAVEFVGRCC